MYISIFRKDVFRGAGFSENLVGQAAIKVILLELDLVGTSTLWLLIRSKSRGARSNTRICIEFVHSLGGGGKDNVPLPPMVPPNLSVLLM